MHPLQIASARIEDHGIAELNRTINLAGLVSTDEYFGLSNVVDPSVELGTAQAAAKAAAAATTSSTAASSTAAAESADNKSDTGASGSSTPKRDNTAAEETKTKEAAASAIASSLAAAAAAAAAVAPSETEQELQEEQRIKAAYTLKRKRHQFTKACQILARHKRRLAAAIQAQSVPDTRLRQLRPQWRLAAPEHGTRAKPHAARATEVVAIDVDVYGSNSNNDPNNPKDASLVQHLVNRVPRYATIELSDEYDVKKDLKQRQQQQEQQKDKDDDKKDSGDKMDIDKDDDKNDTDTSGKETTTTTTHNTRAEPFAIIDPTLGKVAADFDPSKVTMLTLQFNIEKSSTGFCQSACLEPLTITLGDPKDDDKAKETTTKYKEDEKLLVSLQHSLFCAKLFESIRKELVFDKTTEDSAAASSTAMLGGSNTTQAWLTSACEENFLPPPSLMAKGVDGRSGLASLCVVYCHDSEVKVQLDSEYTLGVKLG